MVVKYTMRFICLEAYFSRMVDIFNADKNLVDHPGDPPDAYLGDQI